MAYALEWDKIGERFYETGVDHGVLYHQVKGAYPVGVAWSGLTNVTESPSGAEESAYYADNIKYLALRSNEEFGGTIESYFYPDEFSECLGEAEGADGVILSQQKRKSFGFTYRTKLGNDTEFDDYGYKIHLWYGCTTSPSERSRPTVNESPEPTSFSFEIATTPVPVEGYRPTSTITIDSTKCDQDKLKEFEEILYGKAADNSDPDAPVAAVEPRLPLPDEVLAFFAAG